MKKLLLIGFLLVSCHVTGSAQSDWMKDVIDEIPITSPPTSDISKTLRKSIYIPKEDREFPDITYSDLQRTQPQPFTDPRKEGDCSANFQFRKPNNTNYTVLGVGVYESDAAHVLLVSYDLSANQLDWVEVQFKFADLALKQYQITPDMQVSVYELKPTATEPIIFLNDNISSVRA